MRFLAGCSAALVLAACVPTHRSVVVEPSGRAPVVRGARPAAQVPGSYRVMRGDTLYSIAFRHDVDFRDLAAWNHIAAPYTIWPGQLLRLAPPHAGVASARSPAARAARPANPPPPAPVFEPASPAAASSGTRVAGPVAPAAPAVAPPAPVAAPPAAVAAPVRGTARGVAGVQWRWPADGSLIKRFKAGDAIPGIELAGKAGDPVRAAADGVVVYSGNGLVGYGELIIIKHNDSFLSAYGHNRKRLVKEGQRVSAGQLIAEMGATGASRDELQFQIRRDGNPVDPLDYLPAR
jgi:lipoprotein NlpD